MATDSNALFDWLKKYKYSYCGANGVLFRSGVAKTTSLFRIEKAISFILPPNPYWNCKYGGLSPSRINDLAGGCGFPLQQTAFLCEATQYRERNDMQALTEDHASESLTAREMKALESHATVETYEDGEVVFSAGTAEIDLFVVQTGRLEILNPQDDNAVVAVHEPGQFSGDIDLLTRRPVIVTARASGKTRVLRVPAAKLHEVMLRVPTMSEKMLTAFCSRRNSLGKRGKLGLKVVGPPRCKATTLIREFLYKNFVPYTYHESDKSEGQRLRTELGSPALPFVQCSNGTVLVKPSLRDIANGAGIWRHCPNYSVDLAIVGAGPAGLTAAVYAASEGFSTLVLDKLGPGGQAGGSSKIENFIGFPSGLSGTELATRGVLQMLKFGAQLVAPVEVSSISRGEDGRCALPLDCGAVISARVVLIAAGVVWKKLEALNADRFERAGVYYACTSVEAVLHNETDVAVVGGGNSAGQAAMFLSQCCPGRKVHLLVRSKLGPSMSEYLHSRILANQDIVVHEYATIQKVNGEQFVRSVDVQSNDAEIREIPVGAVFVFIGSEPSHSWLPATIERDAKGFLKAGIDALNSGKWPLTNREPCPLETTMPNVLVAGDIRSGSTKRVGFAVGDGSQAVSCVHTLLTQ